MSARDESIRLAIESGDVIGLLNAIDADRDLSEETRKLFIARVRTNVGRPRAKRDADGLTDGERLHVSCALHWEQLVDGGRMSGAEAFHEMCTARNIADAEREALKRTINGGRADYNKRLRHKGFRSASNRQCRIT